MTPTKKLQIFSWLLGVTVVLLAIIAWTQVRLTGRELTPYDFFPVLGLSAFGLMWTHFTTGTLRRILKLPPSTLKTYFAVTSWIVLVLIILHPGIFLGQLWIDGLGLPPFSYWEVYTDLASRTALLFGSLSLLAFLAYEFRRKFKTSPWWRYVEYVNIAAMFAILYHGFTLGGELDLVWFQIVWLFYTITLVASVVYNQVQRKKRV